jgi:hypothetical protein
MHLKVLLPFRTFADETGVSRIDAEAACRCSPAEVENPVSDSLLFNVDVPQTIETKMTKRKDSFVEAYL